jgi:ribonuclease HI
VVVRTLHGRVLLWRSFRAPAHTNNEAEYQAVIAGLQVMQQHFPGIGVRCLTDSQIVVLQLTGQAAVRAAVLQPLYQQTLTLVQQVGAVEFQAIPRPLNRLADSLAWEALDGRRRIGTTGQRHGTKNQDQRHHHRKDETQ